MSSAQTEAAKIDRLFRRTDAAKYVTETYGFPCSLRPREIRRLDPAGILWVLSCATRGGEFLNRRPLCSRQSRISPKVPREVLRKETRRRPGGFSIRSSFFNLTFDLDGTAEGKACRI